MSTHFFGLKDWNFQYSHSLGRNEFGGTGFRNPVDMVVSADDVVYVVSRTAPRFALRHRSGPNWVYIT